MAKVITVTNRRGGTGKTCTTSALGAGLTLRGYKTLCIDLDSQTNLTFDMGASSECITIMDVLTGQADAEGAIQHTDNGDVISGSPQLATADLTLTGKGKEYRLKEAIQPLLPLYDYIIIDTAPSLGVLTVNALTASDSAIITAQAEVHSLQGIGQLYETIKAVRAHSNPALRIDGILITRYIDRTIIARDMRANLMQVAEVLETKVFAQPIRECNALKEAQALQTNIFAYAPRSNAGKDYNALLDELIGASEESKAFINKLLGVDR